MAKRIREKAAKRNAERDKRPQAIAKYVRMSPTKVRAVLDLIRGKDYFEAVGILQGTPRAACEPVLKVLESAGANAENNLNMSKNDLYVAECFANEGMTLKRYWFRSHGSADIIQKRTSHITIILDERKQTPLVSEVKEPVKKTAAKSVKTEKTEKPAKETKTAQEGGNE